MTNNSDSPHEQFVSRRALLEDEHRVDSVLKRHARGGRTARENLLDLTNGKIDVEYGDFAVAAQRSRRPLSELHTETPGDGVLTVIGHVNDGSYLPDKTRTAIIVNDYSVLAGTQGFFHHKKIDRLLGLAAKRRLPIIMYTEGGGGRPGDADVLIAMGGLNVPTFHRWASLAGQVPRVAINHGYCFAGNAALFGAADLRIATRDSWIGMAGPAMIEGGGLGHYQATEVGPVNVHLRNGVVDLLAEDEQHATALAKLVLSYTQGQSACWEAEDQRPLRDALPSHRRLAYDVRSIINTLVDKHSLLEIRADFGKALFAGFARIAGIPMAILASDCRHLGGAIDVEAARKATDLYRLAGRWNLPLVSFIDTPGFMVGPSSEEAGAPGVMSELFIAGSTFTPPIVSIFLRRGYGLGAMAMAGGSFEVPVLAASWPEGEFGAMGLEGAVKLGYKQELEAAVDDKQREQLYNTLLEDMYERGKALETASFLEIDTVIDPVNTRQLIASTLASSHLDGRIGP